MWRDQASERRQEREQTGVFLLKQTQASVIPELSEAQNDTGPLQQQAPAMPHPEREEGGKGPLCLQRGAAKVLPEKEAHEMNRPLTRPSSKSPHPMRARTHTHTPTRMQAYFSILRSAGRCDSRRAHAGAHLCGVYVAAFQLVQTCFFLVFFVNILDVAPKYIY